MKLSNIGCNRFVYLLFCICLAGTLVFLDARTVFSGYTDGSEGLILDSAEIFFVSLKEKKYKDAWELLSERSHRTIINEVYNSVRDSGIEIKKANIVKDFDDNGIIFNNYWNSFMLNFDPDIVLNERVWEFEKIKPDSAVILLKGSGITRLKMFREAGWWKVGFVETFWTGRRGKLTEYLRSLFINK